MAADRDIHRGKSCINRLQPHFTLFLDISLAFHPHFTLFLDISLAFARISNFPQKCQSLKVRNIQSCKGLFAWRRFVQERA